MVDRLDRMGAFFASYISKDKLGLEIGPYDRPFFPRSDHPKIKYADVFTAAQLRKRAKSNAKRDPNKVETVDFVTAETTLTEIAEPDHFDFVYCSHVLEHVPDFITSLQEIETILKPGGLLLCAYPDRKFTFDIDRAPTDLATLIDRYDRKITRPDPETVYDYFTKFRPVKVGYLWKKIPGAKGKNPHDETKARAKAKLAETEYVDVHCNLFTHGEFVEAMSALNRSGHLALEVVDFEKTSAPLNEFFFVLQKPGETPIAPPRQSSLLRRIFG